MSIKRVFLIVLDSVGIGELPDAKLYQDEGSNTFRSCYQTGLLQVPNMEKLGIFHVDGMDYAGKNVTPQGIYARLAESSAGKDTTTGHWEIAGIISTSPMPTYPEGFPEEIIREFEKRTGKKVLCNLPFSGTEVIDKYGKQHMETGDLIVYTSADSVFQIAAHEDIVPVDELYEYCMTARRLLTGEHGVGRVIARPFVGEAPDFKRTSRRHDFSLEPPKDTICDYLHKQGFDVIGVGKIHDIFAGRSIAESTGSNKDNRDGMDKTMNLLEKDFKGLAFVNLVDFDMVYGHRNDVIGYTKALNEFDLWLGKFLESLKDDDIVFITADHGCDPATPSTDHSREYVPLLGYGKQLKSNVNLGTRASFADISATIADLYGIDYQGEGVSFKDNII